MKTCELKTGTILRNRYRLLRVLGAGGFGITYLAEDQMLSQSVVIKEFFPMHLVSRAQEEGKTNLVLPREKNDRKRFLRGKKDFLLEARRMSQLFSVPAVVKVLDWFETNQTAYLVMEHVKGISLEKWLWNLDEPYSFAKAWEMLRPVAETLAKIHRKGIIHRDLNPSNLMMQEDGSLKIIDFGSARPYLDTEKTMTVLIKKGYAPPEQYLKTGKQGPWTDVYALCATLYEMVTGVRPEPSIDRMQKDTLYLPSAYGAEIQPQEEEILCRGLELSPKKRCPDMTTLILDVDMVQDHPEEQGVNERKAVKTQKKQGKTLKQSALHVMAVSAIATVCIIGILGVWIMRGPKQESSEYAGNYGRNTERYKEYLEFVAEHSEEKEIKEPSVYAKEQGESCVYTLSEGAAKEWGKPCNELHFNKTAGQFLKYMKDNGYVLEKQQQEQKDTVEVGKYGMIKTFFHVDTTYRTAQGVLVKVRSDSVNETILALYVLDPKEKKKECKMIFSDMEEFLHAEYPYYFKEYEGENENMWSLKPNNSHYDYEEYYWP